jgi:MYXO-CTERM domain-containing protein
MKRVKLASVVAVAGLFCLLTGQAQAGEASRFSQSVEGFTGKTLESAVEEIELAEVHSLPVLETTGAKLAPETAARTAAVIVLPGYEIFDAYSEVSLDDDDDGFYRRLRVVFDADVAEGEALVYARLYLSYEGGPWNHYYTTDVFHIVGDSVDDEYAVVTHLLEGYPTGYYDVQIELYDADLDVHVASYGADHDRDLSLLPLEDKYRDEPGGGGAFGLLGLLLLGLMRGRRQT